MRIKQIALWCLIICTSLSCTREESARHSSLNRAKTLFLENYPEKAYDILLPFIRKYPPHPEGTLWLIRLYLFSGKTDKAENLAEEALSRDPREPRLLALLGVCREEQGDYQQAIAFYKRALLFKEELAVTHIRLGSLYFRTGNPGKAEKELTEACSMLSKENLLFSASEALLKEIRSMPK